MITKAEVNAVEKAEVMPKVKEKGNVNQVKVRIKVKWKEKCEFKSVGKSLINACVDEHDVTKGELIGISEKQLACVTSRSDRLGLIAEYEPITEVQSWEQVNLDVLIRVLKQLNMVLMKGSDWESCVVQNIKDNSFDCVNEGILDRCYGRVCVMVG